MPYSIIWWIYYTTYNIICQHIICLFILQNGTAVLPEHILGVYCGFGTGVAIAGIILFVRNMLLLGNEEKLKKEYCAILVCMKFLPFCFSHSTACGAPIDSETPCAVISGSVIPALLKCIALINGEMHDFGGGSLLPPYSASFWKMEK